MSQIIDKHDKTGDAMVDFAEFKEIFFNPEDEAENARVKEAAAATNLPKRQPT